MVQAKISLQPNNDTEAGGGRRERQRARMRERLTAAALELFAAQGFEETTIDQVAERADVARQTVLNHFPRKVDFARAWGQARRDQLTGSSSSADGDEGAEAAVRRFFAAAAERNERERDLTRAMLRSLAPTEIFQFIGGVPSAVIKRGQERGEFVAEVDPAVASELLTSVYFGTVSRWLSDGPPPFDLAAALAQRVELVLSGLRT